MPTNHSTTKPTYHHLSEVERGTNENFNGLLREFVPTGVSLNELTQEDLAKFILAINNRLRRLHNYQYAKKLFELAQIA